MVTELAASLTTITFPGISALGQRWEWRVQDESLVRDMERYLELSELLAQFLVGRGHMPETVPDYLNPTLRALLPDPMHLRDMDKAVARLVEAIERRESVAVFGDYDVDGATSSALLMRYFRLLGLDMIYHIPDRQKEGYGPNAPALLALKEQGVSLVITVDCGAVAFEPLKQAADAELDVIVVDHHKGAAALPEAVAVVNPNRLDETSDYRHLAAVGVTFLLLVALNTALKNAGYFRDSTPPDLRALLDVVALGTVCDVVPLTTVNRAFVTQGLKILSQRRNPGLATLLEQAGVMGEVTAYHAGFVIGPRINAGGRVGEADLGVRLLTSEDPAEQAEIAAALSRYNEERRAIEMLVLDEAMTQAEMQADAPMILVAGEGWHPGVIGIVASRIKDRFHRPVAVVALDGESGKASARSVSGVDIGAVIVAAREQGVIIEGGGHAMAGGFSLKTSALEEVRQFFCEHMKAAVETYLATRTLKLDGLLTTAMANPATVAELERAAPFGMGNASPVLAVHHAKVVAVDILKEQHLRLIVTDASGGRLKVMCFRCVGTPMGDRLTGARGKMLHLAGTLKSEIWQNRPQVTFMVSDAMCADA